LSRVATTTSTTVAAIEAASSDVPDVAIASPASVSTASARERSPFAPTRHTK
jgi:hypothetical protein